MADKTNAAQEADISDSKKKKHFRLLDLPAEVRNHIYEIVMEESPQAYLIASNRGKLFCHSVLARTNKQIRGEIMSFLQSAATDLVAEVKNFDFGHVITFFNKLGDAELRVLPTLQKRLDTQQRKMIVSLNINQSLHYLNGRRNLQRWLNRLVHPTKKGANVVVSYRWDFKSDEDVKNHVRQDLQNVLDRLTYLSRYGGRELRKEQALQAMVLACESA